MPVSRKTTLDDILRDLAAYQEKLDALRQKILTDLVFVSETPAPTFGEEARNLLVTDRFREENLQNISVDEAGNASAILPGQKGKGYIMVAAHADTICDAETDHTARLKEGFAQGVCIADNSLGVAMVTTLPHILRELGIKLEHNLLLVSTTKSLGRGNVEGMNFFLDHFKEREALEDGDTERPIKAGLCIEGVTLGRLSYACLGMERGEIVVEITDEDFGADVFSSRNAMIVLNSVISKLLAIPLPQDPRTMINLGSVRCGTSFHLPPQRGKLRFEVLSEQAGQTAEIHRQIEEIVAETQAETNARVSFEVFARRQPGGFGFNHPLVAATRGVMDKLAIQPIITPSMSDLSALISRGIPGVTLGITTGEHIHEDQESIHIGPISTGVAQLVGALRAMDAGLYK